MIFLPVTAPSEWVKDLHRSLSEQTWDWFTGLEGFNLRKVLPGLPSVPLFFFITSVILFCYSEDSIFSDLPFITSSVFFIFSSIACFHKYYPLITRFGIRGLIYTAFLCIILLSISAYTLTHKIAERILITHLPDELDSPIVTIVENRLMRIGTAFNFVHLSDDGDIYKGYLFVQGDIELSPGDTILLHKSIKRSDVSKSNSFVKKLYREGIHFSVYAFPDDITLIMKGDNVRSRAGSILLAKIDSIFQPEAAAMIKALYSGNRNYISSRVATSFRDSGVLHVLAASGLHVGIIASIPMLLLFSGLNRKFLMGISLFLVLSYLFITEMPVSLLRAAAMFSLVYVQILLNRPVSAMNSLFLAGSVILLLMPWEIYNPGFQLSFGATAGIILFYRRYAQVFSSLPGFFRDSFAVTLAAQSVTAPVIFYHMDQINLASLPANLAAIPLIAAIMILSLAALVVSPMSLYPALFLSEVTCYVYKILLEVTEFFSGMSLNYYAESGSVLLITAFLLSLFPILNLRITRRLKYFPVALSIIIAFTVLEKRYPEELKSINISSGISSISVLPGDNASVRLMIKDYGEGRMIFDYFRKYNINPAVIEINEYSYANTRFARRMMSDYRINEIIINENMAAARGMDEIYLLADSEKINLVLKKDFKN